METIPVSEFKARCLAILERVRQTGESVVVTKHGVPLALVEPPPPPMPPRDPIGSMAGTVQELGDIVAPLDDGDWEALR